MAGLPVTSWDSVNLVAAFSNAGEYFFFAFGHFGSDFCCNGRSGGSCD